MIPCQIPFVQWTAGFKLSPAVLPRVTPDVATCLAKPWVRLTRR